MDFAIETLQTAWMPGFGEWIVILIIVVLVFGTSKLTGLGKSVGTAIRDFKDALHGEDETQKPPKNGDSPEKEDETQKPPKNGDSPEK